MKILFLCTSFMLIFYTLSAQKLTRRERLVLEQRGTDSAWIFQRSFANDHFYFGTKRVSQIEFENTLRNSDPEVEACIKRANRRRAFGLVTSAAGSTLTLIGLNQLRKNYRINNNPNPQSNLLNNGLFLTVLGGCFDITTLILTLGSSDDFRQGIRIFNLKAKKGLLNKNNAVFRFGLQNNGIGIALHF